MAIVSFDLWNFIYGWWLQYGQVPGVCLSLVTVCTFYSATRQPGMAGSTAVAVVSSHVYLVVNQTLFSWVIAFLFVIFAVHCIGNNGMLATYRKKDLSFCCNDRSHILSRN